ncbi:general substrate transporter [Clohesyomyces aquaticus]|uniref:General substrate transporter n=1 Tax=Clohesyomyces aquaticus TaxID=1231657 RepID=A0A1Y1YUT2_9PLEO|nr:general substrate transporter [Clohesyomyces aquaticus]
MGFFPLAGTPLTVGITLTCSFSFMLFGWDQGVFGGILNNDSFDTLFNHPNPTIQGQIVSTYHISCIIGAILSIYFSDKLGRRKSVVKSSGFVLIGGLVQATSFSLPQIIIGRIIAGLGIGQSTAVVPMWQAETSKPEHRGKLVALQMVLVIFGINMTKWLNLGMTYVYNSEVTWRFPIAMQCFWALITASLVPFMVESLRWLCFKDRHAEAQVVLARLAAKEVHHEDMLTELAIKMEKAHGKVGWRDAFSVGETQNLRRILLGAGTSVFQHMGGINVVAYYFPVILKESFGFSARMALILSAIDFITLCVWRSMITLAIDRFGRKPLMLMGSIVCGICFMFTAIGFALGTNPSFAMAVSFMFGYHLFYGFSFLSIPFLYPSEINSSRMRNLGNSVAMITNCVFVYVVVIMTGSSLEEIDLMFKIKYHKEKGVSYKEAARTAREETALSHRTVVM